MDGSREAAGSTRGEGLYRLVEEYAALGDHRTGSEVDAATIAWFAAELARRGARVERRPFGFDRYVADWSVAVDGIAVTACPLFYEAVGTARSRAPFVAAAAVLARDRTAASLEQALDRAREAGATLAVIATENPAGYLQVPNRAPLPGEGPPTLLVAGALAERLRRGAVTASLEARVEPGQSENVEGHFGDTEAAPIVIATPLSGWFRCAGERGTGIAIALEVAERLAGRYPVLVVGTSGHELLPHLGLATYLAGGPPPARCVVHLGANLATGEPGPDGSLALGPARLVSARVDREGLEELVASLQPTRAELQLDPPEWRGEARLWAAAGDYALLSFVGAAAVFHTPEDVPSVATSPELLEKVADAVEAAVECVAVRSGH
ncbi:MAG TPA: hypothetical protein VMU89_05735 [Thermomicrobiaceae bacterium]|nr:hypothetical protein [Thermomicrobiaceae bacterium]